MAADSLASAQPPTGPVRTLQIMLVVAMIGMPLVLLYTSVVDWTFRRRVELGKHSY
jgi:cytochrome bd-type quinol oxidase subunit 2